MMPQARHLVRDLPEVPLRARDNPFAAQRLDRLSYRLAPGERWEALLDRLEELGFSAAVVGAHGRGKTTLLDGLARRLAERDFEIRRRILSRGDWGARLDRNFLTGLTHRHLLLVDGADLLGPFAWRRLRRASRAAAGLVITAHSPGLLPTLVRCTTSPVLLAALVRRLHPDGAASLEPFLPELFHHHRGNLRDVLRELYDLYAGRPSAVFVL